VLSQRCIRRDVAITGEVTLRGRVLEIGGVKEKVLAAYRAGLRRVVMPEPNEKDLRDIPDEVRKQMTFTFVSTMDDVLKVMLMPKLKPELADSGPARKSAPRKREKPVAADERTDDTVSVAKG
jgi:ATP-dependent Lon protease